MKFLPHILITAAIVAVVSGIMALVFQPSGSGGMQITLPSPTPVGSSEIGVYVTGAVQFPGVYSMAEGDRLQQALQAAGGPTADADLNAVNLAIRLRDEDHWNIPELGDSPSAASANSFTVAGSPENAGSPKVDVNSADVQSLKTLPGIGEVRANAIVAFRQTNGPFPTVDDLLAVNGIGSATLEAIRALIEAR